MKTKETITYYLRGSIERSSRAKRDGRVDYIWKDGYSPNTTEGHIIYPWVTKREAQIQEKAQGRKVLFEEKRKP